MNSIFTSFEMNAWSRDLSYEEYVHLIRENSSTTALSLRSFKAFCNMMDDAMEEFYKRHPNDL